jgi:hypothetical protein
VCFLEAREATVHQKAQVSIVIVKVRQGIKGHAVQRDERGGRENGLLKEGDPMDTVIKIRQPNRIYQTISWKGKAWEREDERWIREYDGNHQGASRKRTQTNEAVGVAEGTIRRA